MHSAVDVGAAVDALHNVELANARPALAVLAERVAQRPERGPDARAVGGRDVGQQDACADEHLLAGRGHEVGANRLNAARRPCALGVAHGRKREPAGARELHVGCIGRKGLDFAGAPLRGAACVLRALVDDPVAGAGGGAGSAGKVVEKDGAIACWGCRGGALVESCR